MLMSMRWIKVVRWDRLKHKQGPGPSLSLQTHGLHRSINSCSLR